MQGWPEKFLLKNCINRVPEYLWFTAYWANGSLDMAYGAGKKMKLLSVASK